MRSSGQDGTVRVWNLRSRTDVTVYSTPNSIVGTAFFPDGTLFVYDGAGELRLIRPAALQRALAMSETQGNLQDLLRDVSTFELTFDTGANDEAAQMR